MQRFGAITTISTEIRHPDLSGGNGGATVTLGYDYDLADRIVRITYPSGRIVDYLRDGKGRVTNVVTKASAVEPNWTTLATNMSYEPWGSITGASFGNGLALDQSWGNDGRLATKRLFNVASSVDLSSLAYDYDNDDNIAAITDALDPARSIAYGYDNRGRLAQSVGAVGPVKRNDYRFDLNGNRTSVEYRAEPGDAAPLASDVYTRTAGTNRLASVTTSDGTRTTSYDARGNTLSTFRPGVAVSVGYDGHGRLVSYTRSDQPDRTNAYNGLDERVKVTTSDGWNTTLRHYVYDLDHRLIGEYGATGAAIAETIWLQPEVKKHLHDARGTFATKLMTTTNLTDAEIADIMGWSPTEVERVRKVYVDQRATVVAIGKRIARGVNRPVTRNDCGERDRRKSAIMRV